MREYFTRVEDGQEVAIEVAMNAFAFSEKFTWLFSVFIKFDARDETQSGYEDFLETKEALRIALEHDEKAKFVGMRVVDGWSELYFYANSAKSLEMLTTKMLRDTGYLYESSVVKDTKWDFHYKNLMPTERELCHIESQKIIEMLEEEGDDLESVRSVEHYLSFELPTQKERFINTLNLEGFRFKDEISSEEFEHGVALVKEHNVTPQEVTKVLDELFNAVKKLQGYYEGWSTVLLPKENSQR